MVLDFSEKGKKEFYSDALKRILENNFSIGSEEEKKKNYDMIQENMNKYNSMRKNYFAQLTSLAKLKKACDKRRNLDKSLLTNEIEEDIIRLEKRVNEIEWGLKKFSSTYEKDLEETIKSLENPFPDYMKN